MEQPVRHRPASAAHLAKPHRRRISDKPKRSTASAVTNGTKVLLPLTEGAFRRRLRDLLDAHVSDLGGWDNVSSAESALIRRAVVLIVELERRETVFASVGYIDDNALAIYQSSTNTLRRTLESLGLQRRARDIGPTLSDILRADQQRQREILVEQQDATATSARDPP
jgi:hypothetical protein